MDKWKKCDIYIQWNILKTQEGEKKKTQKGLQYNKRCYNVYEPENVMLNESKAAQMVTYFKNSIYKKCPD